LDVHLQRKRLGHLRGMRGEGSDVSKRSIVQRDHHRPKPITQSLKHLRRVAKSAEHTLGRKMSALEGGEFVLLVKALRQNKSGQIHGM
jgi:hypothetical protein